MTPRTRDPMRLMVASGYVNTGCMCGFRFKAAPTREVVDENGEKRTIRTEYGNFAVMYRVRGDFSKYASRPSGGEDSAGPAKSRGAEWLCMVYDDGDDDVRVVTPDDLFWMFGFSYGVFRKSDLFLKGVAGMKRAVESFLGGSGGSRGAFAGMMDSLPAGYRDDAQLLRLAWKACVDGIAQIDSAPVQDQKSYIWKNNFAAVRREADERLAKAAAKAARGNRPDKAAFAAAADRELARRNRIRVAAGETVPLSMRHYPSVNGGF